MAESLLERLLAGAASRLRANGNAYIGGDVTLQQGTNVSLTQLGSVITIDASLAALTRVRANASPFISGDVTFANGTGITLSQVGSTITINATTGLPSPYTATLVTYAGIANSLLITGPSGEYEYPAHPPSVVIRGRDNTDLDTDSYGGDALLVGGDLPAGNNGGNNGGVAWARGGNGPIAGSGWVSGGLTLVENGTAGNAVLFGRSGSDHTTLTDVHGGIASVYGGDGKGAGTGGYVEIKAGYTPAGTGGATNISGGNGTTGGDVAINGGGTAGANANGGSVYVLGAGGAGTGSGGTCSVAGGAGGTTGDGGALTLSGGAAGTAGSGKLGGNASLVGGASTGTLGSGGGVDITGGAGIAGGTATVAGGNGTTSVGGNVNLQPGTGTGSSVGRTRVTRGAFTVEEATAVGKQLSETAILTTATTTPTLAYSYAIGTSESVSITVLATADNGTTTGEVVKKAVFRRTTGDNSGNASQQGDGSTFDASVTAFKLSHDVTIALNSNTIEVKVVAASSGSTLWAVGVSIVSRTGPV